MKWIPDKNAKPPMFHELVANGKTVALVRRVQPQRIARKGRVTYRHRYQLVARFVDIVGGAVGPIFPSLIAAKRHAEGRAK